MTVTISSLRPYQGYAAGSVVDLPAELEAALIAQGLAVNGGTLTSGAQSPTVTGNQSIPILSGIVVIPAAGTSVTVNNATITATSKAVAAISQASADATLTSLVRVNCTAGVLTITGNAASTAAVRVSYVVLA